MAPRIQDQVAFDAECARLYHELGTIRAVAEALGRNRETVRLALIRQGVDRSKYGRRRPYSNQERLDVHYRTVRAAKNSPKCIVCGLRLDLDEWGEEWPPADEHVCGFCEEELD